MSRMRPANRFTRQQTRTAATKHFNPRILKEATQHCIRINSLHCTSPRPTAMPAPSKVAIATGSVLRLVKEEASYHKEIAQQEERIQKLQDSVGDSNKEYTLKQEVCFISMIPDFPS
jgi:hypothetical protein